MKCASESPTPTVWKHVAHSRHLFPLGEKRGWRRKTGPIKNLDLVRELYDLAGSHPHARLRWIKAHDGSRWNEYVDASATSSIP